MKSLIARLKTLAVDQPDTEAVVSNGYSINYAQLVKRIENVASEIQRIGFDRLAAYISFFDVAAPGVKYVQASKKASNLLGAPWIKD